MASLPKKFGPLGTASVKMNIINLKGGWAYATTKLLDAKELQPRCIPASKERCHCMLQDYCSIMDEVPNVP
jgi:hypothetical protein